MADPESHPPQNDPAEAFAEELLRISRRQLRERCRRIEACLQKLNTKDIWARGYETENSVGNLILHLSGNVRQWILSGVGGAADQRDRDAEFSRRDPMPTEELLARLRETLDEADAVLARLTIRDLLAKRKIQGYQVSVLHAVYHVVEHFAEHTGQIIWATKRMSGEDLGFYRYLKGGSAREGCEP